MTEGLMLKDKIYESLKHTHDMSCEDMLDHISLWTLNDFDEGYNYHIRKKLYDIFNKACSDNDFSLFDELVECMNKRRNNRIFTNM